MMNTPGQENQRAAPLLCANACGFYGSPTTKNLCSKCYRDLICTEEQKQSCQLKHAGAPSSSAGGCSVPSSSSVPRNNAAGSSSLRAVSSVGSIAPAPALPDPTAALSCGGSFGRSATPVPPAATYPASSSYEQQQHLGGYDVSGPTASSEVLSTPSCDDNASASLSVETADEPSAASTSSVERCIDDAASVFSATAYDTMSVLEPVATTLAQDTAAQPDIADGAATPTSNPGSPACEDNGSRVLPASLIDPPAASSTPSNTLHENNSQNAAASEQPVQVNKQRCFQCNKKIGLLGFRCRCEYFFCGTHRHADCHQCVFDYKAYGKQQLTKANQKVVATKLNRI